MEKQELYRELIKAFNEDDNFNTHNGYHVLKIEDGYCEAEVHLTQKQINHHGTAHGALSFGISDVVAGLAGASSGQSSVTLNSSISFLRPAGKLGETLRAVGKAIKIGRNIGVFETLVYDEQDRLCVRGEFTMFFVGELVRKPDGSLDFH